MKKCVCTFECVLSDAEARLFETGTEQAAVRFGWMMFIVLVAKETSHSAVTEDGDVTTAIIARTSQYRVLLGLVQVLVPQVSRNERNVIVLSLCFVVNRPSVSNHQ